MYVVYPDSLERTASLLGEWSFPEFPDVCLGHYLLIDGFSAIIKVVTTAISGEIRSVESDGG